MDGSYFNYSIRYAATRWQRREFLSQWWAVYAGDLGWSPPAYHLLRRELNPLSNPHLERLSPLMLYLEALYRPRLPRSERERERSDLRFSSLAPAGEQAVGAALALRDPRRDDGAAYLALLHCTNDAESLERLLGAVAEQLAPAGCRRLIGPTGLSPHLGSGLLVDYWNLLPPLHTGYAPPYLPELVAGLMEPLAQAQLYALPLAHELPARPAAATIVPGDPARLAGDLLPLFAACVHRWGDFPPPDAAEAAFLLRWLSAWPLHCLLALVDGEPVGFVLLQPDLAPVLRRARGGRGPLRRLWLALARNRPAAQGRLIFGGVLEPWRGRGIGGLLLGAALSLARQQQWGALQVGPLAIGSPAAELVLRYGAVARQSYILYEQEL